jgi:hypothetical protein
MDITETRYLWFHATKSGSLIKTIQKHAQTPTPETTMFRKTRKTLPEEVILAGEL